MSKKDFLEAVDGFMRVLQRPGDGHMLKHIETLCDEEASELHDKYAVSAVYCRLLASNA